MDPVIILLAIAFLLLIYQVHIRKDKDETDSRGNPKHLKRRY